MSVCASAGLLSSVTSASVPARCAGRSGRSSSMICRMFRDVCHAILPDEHGDRQQQGIRTDQSLQPEKRRRVHVTPMLMHAEGIHGNPKHDEHDGKCKIRRTAEEAADPLDGILQPGNLGLFTVLEARQ
jgi:hypothetical protein